MIQNSLKLRYWIIGGYLVPISLILVSGLLIAQKAIIAQKAAQKFEQSTALEEEFDNYAANINASVSSVRGYLLEPRENFKQVYQESRQNFQQLEQNIDASIQTGLPQETFNDLVDLVETVDAENQIIVNLVDNNQLDAALERWRLNNNRREFERIEKLIKELSILEHEAVILAKQEQAEALKNLNRIVWLAIGLSLALSSIIGFIVIMRLIQRLQFEANAIASTSSEIAAAIEEQERIANQQAASVNQTTSTIEELSASSQQSAQQAESAARGARQILLLANGTELESGTLIHPDNNLKYKSQQIAQQVQRLSDELNRISDIINVVSELANRTNMLALNAAVEAVRAGEVGKGFEVVAAEIRKLADQSRQSAESIAKIVREVQKVTYTTTNATEDGIKAVDQIITAIDEIALNVQQISLNTRQQA
ncbi:MAG: methyl-accepting chemotaxis protein, partial [Spirulinaceae cyanobacterium]